MFRHQEMARRPPSEVKKVQRAIRKLQKTRTIDAALVQRHFRLHHCSLQTIRRVILRRDGYKYVLRKRKPVVSAHAIPQCGE